MAPFRGRLIGAEVEGMTEAICDHADGVWCRLRCPACRGWLAFPAEFDSDQHRPADRLAGRLARRLAVFAWRHLHLGNVDGGEAR
jgi:hypothetical protein